MQPENNSTYFLRELQRISAMNGSPLPAVVRGRRFILTNFAEPLSLGDISSAAFLSRFHFIRQFTLVYGRTPMQLLQSIRIQQAKALLRAGLGVAESCYGVGLSSASSFSILFKKSVGMSPANYRRAMPRSITPTMALMPVAFAKNSNG